MVLDDVPPTQAVLFDKFKNSRQEGKYLGALFVRDTYVLSAKWGRIRYKISCW